MPLNRPAIDRGLMTALPLPLPLPLPPPGLVGTAAWEGQRREGRVKLVRVLIRRRAEGGAALGEPGVEPPSPTLHTHREGERGV
jgi:hypothetical protein